MKPGQTCATCNAFAPLANQCRAKSPTAVPINKGNELAAIGIFPAVDGTIWCRDWQPDAPQA